MSSIIHMETEEVDQTARRVMYGATDLLNILDTLGHQTRRLHGAWQGGRSERVLSSLDRSMQEMRRTAEQLDELSRRVRREVDEWEAADKTPFNLKRYLRGDWQGVLKDAARLGEAGSFALFLRTSAKLPGEIVLQAPPFFGTISKVVGSVFGKQAGKLFGGQNLRAFMGLNKMTNHIKPSNLPKAMLLANVAIDVTPQLIDDFKEYGFSLRFGAAAVVDTIVKGVLSLLPALAGAALIGWAAAVALPALAAIGVGAAAATVIVGGAALIATVGWSIASDRLIQTPLWNLFKSSGWRDEAIEDLVRGENAKQNLLKALLQIGVDKVTNAFKELIQNLIPEPSQATA